MKLLANSVINSRPNFYTKKSEQTTTYPNKNISNLPYRNLSNIPSSAFRYLAINSNNINFQGRPAKVGFEKFKNYLAEINPNDETAALKEVLVNAFNNGKVIGVGKWHEVYSIPGNEDFVVRTAVNKVIRLGKLQQADILFNNFNFGQPIANIVCSDGINTQILRKVHGESIGVPYLIRKAALRMSEIGEKVLVGEDKFIKNIKNIASIPQYAFDDLAEKVKYLRDSGRVYDIGNANNVMLNKNPNTHRYKFHIIDDLPTIDEIKETYGDRAWNGTVEDLAITLMDYNANVMYTQKSKTFTENPELLNKITELNKNILEKCFIASMKADLPLPETNDKLEELFKIAGLNNSDIDKIRQNWDTLKEKVKQDCDLKLF